MPPPGKTIPPARDRQQSSLLVLAAAALFAFVAAEDLVFGLADPYWRRFTLLALGISLAFGAVVLALRAATPAAAGCGTLICFLLTFHTGAPRRSTLHSALVPLLVLFVLTFAATRAGRARKEAHGLAERRRGRAASQIVANLGIAAAVVTPIGDELVRIVSNNLAMLRVEVFPALATACVAALAEAAADTVSSETGQAFAGTPILLTTLRRVPPGTDGAVTLLGTLAGIAAAAIVAAAGTSVLHLPHAAFAVAASAGVFGLFFDSLLGATLERRGLLGNDLVNFTSTLAAATAAIVFFISSL